MGKKHTLLKSHAFYGSNAASAKKTVIKTPHVCIPPLILIDFGERREVVI